METVRFAKAGRTVVSFILKDSTPNGTNGCKAKNSRASLSEIRPQKDRRGKAILPRGGLFHLAVIVLRTRRIR
jgi:hypothetical protein